MRRVRSPRRRRGGFTLLEVVLVAALLGLLLTAAAAVAPALRRLERSDEQALARTQRQRAAVEALRFDLSRAGYGEAAPSLRVERAPGGGGDGGQAVSFAARVDRWRAAPGRRTVRLEAGRDARGAWSLYRADGGAPRQPVVAGVTAVRVVRVATRSGWGPIPPLGGAVDDAVALGLEIDFEWGVTLRTVVALPTPLRVAVGR